METPYWYKLLDFWVNKSKNTDLNIPFLIGAKAQFIDETSPSQFCINNLLNEIVNSLMQEFCVTLGYCKYN